MITRFPASDLVHEQKAASLSYRRRSSALSTRFDYFRKRRCFRLITAVCALAAAIAYSPLADAHPTNKDHHTRRAEKMAFDGRWSLVIETKRGGCGSYRVGLDIVNSTIIYNGSPYGRVSASGLVRVSGSMGNQQAQGTGRLSRMSGAGAWHALVNTDVCDGRWIAERRDRGA